MNQERLLERFLRYVQIDSPSLDEQAMKEHLKKELESMGLEVIEDDAGAKFGSNSGNLIARLEGSLDKTLLFSAHMDTVSPGRGVKPQLRDGLIKSDGQTVLGGDDKAGIAAIMEMLASLKESDQPHHSVEVVFTVGEEVGLLGSKYLDMSQLKADYGFVLDSGNAPGYVVLQAPSQVNMEVTFRGKKAHAGTHPEEGISAIEIAAEAIANMKLLRIDQETTANIGRIEGGVATNIVSDSVFMTAEARSMSMEKLNAQVDHMIGAIEAAQKASGLKAEIHCHHVYPAYRLSAEAMPVKMVEKSCEELGLDFVLGQSGGGSDTNRFNEAGIPSVNLGVGMDKVHTTEEQITIEDLENTCRLILKIVGQK